MGSKKDLDYFLRPAVRRPQAVEKTIRLPEEAAAALQALAYERGESEEVLFQKALEAYVRRAE